MRPKAFDEVLVAVGRVERQTREGTHCIAVVIDMALEVGVALGQKRERVIRLVGGEREQRALVAEAHRLRPLENTVRCQLIIGESVLDPRNSFHLDSWILSTVLAKRPSDACE